MKDKIVIRTQNEEAIILFSNINDEIKYITFFDAQSGEYEHTVSIRAHHDYLNVLGKYQSKERCIEVLDELLVCIVNNKSLYRMPKE